MSICDRLIGCFTPHVNWKALLELLTVEDSEGNQYFNICYNDRAKCESYESAFDCLQDATLEEVLKLIVAEDSCGNPALQVLANICTVCEEEQIR